MAKKTQLKERGTNIPLYPVTTMDCILDFDEKQIPNIFVEIGNEAFSPGETLILKFKTKEDLDLFFGGNPYNLYIVTDDKSGFFNTDLVVSNNNTVLLYISMFTLLFGYIFVKSDDSLEVRSDLYINLHEKITLFDLSSNLLESLKDLLVPINVKGSDNIDINKYSLGNINNDYIDSFKNDSYRRIYFHSVLSNGENLRIVFDSKTSNGDVAYIGPKLVNVNDLIYIALGSFVNVNNNWKFQVDLVEFKNGGETSDVKVFTLSDSDNSELIEYLQNNPNKSALVNFLSGLYLYSIPVLLDLLGTVTSSVFLDLMSNNFNYLNIYENTYTINEEVTIHGTNITDINGTNINENSIGRSKLEDNAKPHNIVFYLNTSSAARTLEGIVVDETTYPKTSQFNILDVLKNCNNNIFNVKVVSNSNNEILRLESYIPPSTLTNGSIICSIVDDWDSLTKTYFKITLESKVADCTVETKTVNIL